MEHVEVIVLKCIIITPLSKCGFVAVELAFCSLSGLHESPVYQCDGLKGLSFYFISYLNMKLCNMSRIP